LKALDGSPDLARHLGPLRVEGGTIQRQVFVDSFADLMDALQVGEFLPPRRIAYARLVRRGDVLFNRGETDEALKVYTEAQRLDPDTRKP